MLLHEKMRLQRKVNQLTYKQLRASSRKERITKSIEKAQKRYSRLESNLDNEAKRLQNMARMQFRAAFGLGVNDFNPYSSLQQNTSGNFTAVWGLMQQGLQQANIDPNDPLVQGFMNGKYRQITQDGQSIYVDTSEQPSDGKYTPLSDSDIQTLQMVAQIQQQAQWGVSNLQSQCSTTQAAYENNVSIWLEARKEQLEAEQDAILEPLQAQETEWELEEKSIETQLQMARERLKNIEQACSEEIKDSAPKFGLG